MNSFDGGKANYYCMNGIEAQDVIEAFELNFSRGSALKYLLRAGRKNDDEIRDLEKAEELLEEDFDYYTNPYVTDAAAKALRARAALYMQDFDTAIEYSTKVIENKNFSSVFLCRIKTCELVFIRNAVNHFC